MPKNSTSLSPAGKLLAALVLGAATGASAVTNQFRGVNWADSRDNFQSGVVYISGLSASDTYASASIVAERVVGQFVSKLGSNTVRLPINEATATQYWGTYTGAIDVSLTKGRVILGYWGKASGANPPDMNAWWNMWTTVVTKYGSNPNFYVEVFNEPSGYNKTDLLNLYDQWLKRFPNFPRKRILLDGSGLAWGVPDVGSDKRFDSCLLAVHDYTFFAGSDMTTETKWANHIKGYVGNYADRTVATEWGGPMTTGSKNGVTYQPMDYGKSATNFFEAYIRGISQQLHDWKMGGVYWPGLRDGDWYSMTNKSGTGANIQLTVPNQSGLARLHYSWTDTTPTAVSPRADQVAGLALQRNQGSLRVEFTAPYGGETSVLLVDMSGRSVASQAFSTVEGSVYVRDLDPVAVPQGLYVVRITTAGRNVGQAKVVLGR